MAPACTIPIIGNGFLPDRINSGKPAVPPMHALHERTHVRTTKPSKNAKLNRPNSYERAKLSNSIMTYTLPIARLVSDPAEWSLLSCTLPEVLNISSSCYNTSIIEDNTTTISTLGIFPHDIAELRKIAIFPEDPVELLLFVTVGYILQVDISEESLSIIHDHLLRIHGLTDRSLMSISTENVSDIAIYADIQTSLFEEFHVRQFTYPEIITKRDRRASIVTWGDISTITERRVIERLGFTARGLKAIQQIWQLKERALELEKLLSNGLPVWAYGDFELLVDTFFSTITKKERAHIILKGRLGLLDGRTWTLEELGQRENLTRERIRQIEKKWMSTFKKRHAADRLYRIWLALNEILMPCGGVCCAAEVAESLSNRWKWPTPPSADTIASLISLSKNYKVVWDATIRVIMPKHKCVNCSRIGPFLTRALKNERSEVLSFNDANVAMLEFCRCHCDDASVITHFEKGFYQFLADSIEEISVDETAVYSEYAWAQKYGKQRMILIETTLRNAGHPMHFTEVHSEINKNRPHEQILEERNIYGLCERSPALLLWDRGTFIHRDHVSIPIALISEIENDIISRLRDEIPYLSITGIFEGYKHNLLAEGIPTANALYSCMRITNNKALDCPDYPYVLRRESEGHRLPIPLVLEAFVLEQEGVVTSDQIKSFAIEKLCVNEAVFTTSHLSNIPNLLRINSGEYLHLHQLGIEEDKLAPIIDHLIKLLENYDHVSAEKLFEDKKITCKLLGISTPMLLFSLIQLFYFDQFDLSRYPQIRLSGVVTDKNRTAGVALEVINYICEKALPCSFAELYQHFVDELGYKQNSVHNVLYTYKSILRYSKGVIVHLATLGWTEDKQAALEILAVSHLNNRKNTDKPFGLIFHLYNYMYDQLPKLPDNISWTPTLIGELLSYEKRYRILGTQRNAFVAVTNSYGIETLEDLLYYILDAEYDGAANIDRFIADMREDGILMKSLTPVMLGPDSRIVINGTVVQLARLRDYVEGN